MTSSATIVQHSNQIATVNVDQLKCGPLANVMAALSNIGGVLCSKAQSLADAHY